eukprot:361051-Chlamydomonas_euryale.AAC.4
MASISATELWQQCSSPLVLTCVPQVVVVDASAAAMDAVRSRNAEARTGLTVLCGDVAAQPFPLLPQPTQRFDLVVDKGTVDCLLGARDGWRAAERALRELYERMRTPGTLLLVSHSPPHERMDMLASVPHWHDVQVSVGVGAGRRRMGAFVPHWRERCWRVWQALCRTGAKCRLVWWAPRGERS